MRWFALSNRTVEAQDAVAEPLRHLAALKAATVAECAFCLDIGSELARRSGLSDAQLLALHDPEASPGLFDATERLVLAYADGLSRSPAVSDDETADALRAVVGDRGFIELTHLIAWEALRARLNVGLGVPPGGFSEGRACARPASAASDAAVAAPAQT